MFGSSDLRSGAEVLLFSSLLFLLLCARLPAVAAMGCLPAAVQQTPWLMNLRCANQTGFLDAMIVLITTQECTGFYLS